MSSQGNPSLTQPAPAPGSRRSVPQGLVVLTLSITASTASIQQSAVIPLLPRLEQSLNASVSAVSWALTVSLLCGAVATPLFSRFGDMYGRRRMLLLTLALLVGGSVVGALSTSITTLMIARVLQGVSAATVPLSIGAVRDLLPPEKMATGIGVLSATMGIGVGLGMIISGFIAEYTSGYRIVFWLITGLAAAATVLTALVVRDVAPPAGGRPDVPGAVVFTGALVCLLLAITEGRSWGWTSASIVGLLVAAVALFAIWVAIERRATDPLVDIAMLTHPGTIGASLASFLLGFALYAGFTLLPNYVQTPSEAGYGFGASVLMAGVYLLPTTLLLIVISPLAGRLVRKTSAATMVAIGSVVAALSNVWLILRHDHPYDIYVATALLGLGVGLSFAALGTMAVEHVDPAKTAVASAVNSLVRLVGGSIASSLTAAILTSDTTAGGVPTEHAYETSFTIAAISVGLAALFAGGFGWLNRARTAAASPAH